MRLAAQGPLGPGVEPGLSPLGAWPGVGRGPGLGRGTPHRKATGNQPAHLGKARGSQPQVGRSPIRQREGAPAEGTRAGWAHGTVSRRRPGGRRTGRLGSAGGASRPCRGTRRATACAPRGESPPHGLRGPALRTRGLRHASWSPGSVRHVLGLAVQGSGPGGEVADRGRSRQKRNGRAARGEAGTCPGPACAKPASRSGGRLWAEHTVSCTQRERKPLALGAPARPRKIKGAEPRPPAPAHTARAQGTGPASCRRSCCVLPAVPTFPPCGAATPGSAVSLRAAQGRHGLASSPGPALRLQLRSERQLLQPREKLPGLGVARSSLNAAHTNTREFPAPAA